jgi:hypothetical protein
MAVKQYSKRIIVLGRHPVPDRHGKREKEPQEIEVVIPARIGQFLERCHRNSLSCFAVPVKRRALQHDAARGYQ